MDRWKGRVALVTGASAGIGAAVAEELVQHGMKVVGCARNVEKIQVMFGGIMQIACLISSSELVSMRMHVDVL